MSSWTGGIKTKTKYEVGKNGLALAWNWDKAGFELSAFYCLVVSTTDAGVAVYWIVLGTCNSTILDFYY